MTTKTIHYDDRDLMRTGKLREANNGFRAMSTSFTNNDERQGYDVLYDDTPDVEPAKRQMTRLTFVNKLAEERNVELV